MCLLSHLQGKRTIFITSILCSCLYTELCLGALLNQLHLVRARWYNIGLQLGIPYNTLDCFKQMYSDPSDLMREMLKHWLQTAVKPHPSWEAVVAALRSHCVDEQLVAEQLESKYCTLVQSVMHENKNPTTAEKSKGTYKLFLALRKIHSYV